MTRIYTNEAVFLIGPDGVRVRETFGTTFAEPAGRIDIPLLPA